METKNLIVGIDLNRKESQVCYYERGSQDAVSAPVKVGSTKVTFPTVLCRIPDTGEWYYGLEAEYFAEQKNGILIDRLYDFCADGNSFSAEGEEFTGGELLAVFLRQALTMLGVSDIEKQVAGIMLTVPYLSKPFVQAIREAYRLLGIQRSRGYLQDYQESFYFHTLYQKPELWTRKVGLFQFTREDVTFFCLELNQRTKPVTASVTEGGTIRLAPGAEERDAGFRAFIQESLKDDLYSSIFLVGEGFERSWAVRSLALLCRGQRRVFIGDNLFARGACFAAREKVEEKNLKGYLYVGADLIRCNVGMEMKINGCPAYYPLVTAGVNWYEAEKECELILDGMDELIFVVSKMDDGKRSRYSMALPGLPRRPARATRLKLHLEYESPRRCRIRVEDLGFGELFPSSGKIWQETMEE
ncbi:MAG TPA: hypothetical protein IAB71_05625 [Candidatus Scatomonas pullistercoris]|uniref:DUF5716 domain-containing protein n=1 Tax=Candidatus Scatomonas pullistercoris TaxID=2840920 RepID=A0A9D1TB26_9FIRM|nr:hypothetical protein [Candidatus Scatomonas pullistercoris]